MSPLQAFAALILCFATLVAGAGDHSGLNDITQQLTLSTGIRITDSAKAIIDTMSSVAHLPSCNKVASASLINTCSELDGDKALSAGMTVDGMLDQSKAIYAARLAICELSDAQAHIPEACSAFTPNKRTTWKSFVMPGRRTEHQTYEEDTVRSLERCLKALSSKPQSWTSYSNAKQNAIVMCHAMRASIDKDEHLEIFRMVVELNEQTMGAMASATRDFEGFLKDFASIRKDMESFQMSLNEGSTEVTERLEKFWSDLHGNVQDLDSSITSILEHARRAGNDLAQYNDDSSLVHNQALKALMAIASTIEQAQFSTSTSLELQAEINKHLLDALNFTISASRSASDVDALMSDLTKRLNETVEVAETLRDTLFEKLFSREFFLNTLIFFAFLVLGDAHKSVFWVLAFFFMAGVLAWPVQYYLGFHNVFSYGLMSFSLSAGSVRIMAPFATEIVENVFHACLVYGAFIRMVTQPVQDYIHQLHVLCGDPAWTVVCGFVLSLITTLITYGFIMFVMHKEACQSLVEIHALAGSHYSDNRHHSDDRHYSYGTAPTLHARRVRLPCNDPRYFTEGKGAKYLLKTREV